MLAGIRYSLLRKAFHRSGAGQCISQAGYIHSLLIIRIFYIRRVVHEGSLCRAYCRGRKSCIRKILSIYSKLSFI